MSRALRPNRVVIFADPPDWHSRCLGEALQARGIDFECLPLRRVTVTVGCDEPAIRVPGFGSSLPAAALVKTVSKGSFEQVTRRLTILHTLEDQGVVVFNRVRSIERCVDKSWTSLLLQAAGLPMPPSWTVETQEEAAEIVAAETAQGHELVFKPLFGAQGRGLLRLDGKTPIPSPEDVNGVYYLQRYIDLGEGQWRDFRVFVIGGRAVTAMSRRGVSWITNAGQGASCETARVSDEMMELAEAAACAIGVDYAGVDIMADRQGCLYLLEVNSMPAWKGLQGVTSIDIADEIVKALLSRLSASSSHTIAAHKTS